MKEMNLLMALEYASKGWLVLPMHFNQDGKCSCYLGIKCKSSGKHPKTDHAVKNATTDEKIIHSWWNQWPDAEVGIATGQISGLVVVDIDPRNGGNYSLEKLEDQIGKLPFTLEVHTRGGGRHLYFRYPQRETKITLKKNLQDFKGIDFLSNGHLVKTPPSEGYVHEVSFDLEKGQLAEIPSSLLSLLECSSLYQNKTLETHPVKKVVKIQTGQRNKHLASIAGTMRRRGMEHKAIEVALLETNLAQCSPPLENKEVKNIAASISKYPSSENSLDNQSIKGSNYQLLLKESQTWEFFHDERKNPYVRIPEAGKHMIFNIGSEDFKYKVLGNHYQKFGNLPPERELKEVIDFFRGKALFSGKRYQLSTRFAKFENSILIDLCNENWQQVQVSAEGWNILEKPIIAHVRYNHQFALPVPEIGGTFEDLLRFFNVKRREHKILLLTYIITALIPDIPRPILNFYGPEGSGKTEASRLIKKMIDPSIVEFLELTNNEAEMSQILEQHALPIFDNQGFLKQRTVNLLCRASTGGGFAKRKLYTDNDTIFFTFKRPVILNGINLPSAAPDFLDRCILIELERISPEQRQAEGERHQEFNQLRPRLFGGLLDILSEAMKIYPDVQLRSIPRMADFARWGAAVSIALGYSADDFLNAIDLNRETKLSEVLEDDPVFTSLVDYLFDESKLEGTSTEILRKLENKFCEQTRYKSWPNGPEALSKRLRKLHASLTEFGITIHFSSGRRKGRLITIKKEKKALN